MKVKTMLVIIDICLFILGMLCIFNNNVNDLKHLIILLLISNAYFINRTFDNYKDKSINIDLVDILKKIENKLKK
ncbi:SVM family protein [Clostridium perfringens]|uniref:SVM family protein n=1 Tax=Clostridium perfringens TaxID=1502 RepID=UPI00338F4AA4|nr:SVM family protein [Clostridium perfringens]